MNDVLHKITQNKRKDEVSIETMMIETALPSINQITIESILMEMWRNINFDLQFARERELLREQMDGHRSMGQNMALVPLQKKSFE